MLWGLVMQFMAGYLFLHCWNNLFGELLRFADREFYSVSRSLCGFQLHAVIGTAVANVPFLGLVDLYIILTVLSQVESTGTRLDQGLHLPRPQNC